MLETLKLKLACSAVNSALRSLATNKDTQSTIAGILAGAVISVPGFDLSKLIAGDSVQIAHLVAGLLMALIGLWATKARRDGQTTSAGALAGVLYSLSGQINDVIVGVVIALLGFYTNKPVAPPTPPR